VEEAFLPTLKTLFSAPVSSPLASVNINNVAELLVHLTNSKHLKKEGNSIDTTEVSSIHASLSLAVANEILSCPEAPGVRILCKILPMMDLTGCAQSTVKEMKILTTRMIEEIEDGTSLKSLNKFHKTLKMITNSLDDNDGGDGDVSQTEPEEDTQANTEETEDTNESNGTSINDADNCERLEGNNSLSQETESAEHTHVGSNTEAGDHSEVLMEESPQVLNKTKEQNKLPKTKSRTKSNKQGAKSTARNTELR